METQYVQSSKYRFEFSEQSQTVKNKQKYEKHMTLWPAFIEILLEWLGQRWDD